MSRALRPRIVKILAAQREPQKFFSLTKFLLNPNSSIINAIGVWCSLVQRALAHFQTFLLLKKIAQLLGFVASF
jgi:hypothetical protein